MTKKEFRCLKIKYQETLSIALKYRKESFLPIILEDVGILLERHNKYLYDHQDFKVYQKNKMWNNDMKKVQVNVGFNGEYFCTRQRKGASGGESISEDRYKMIVKLERGTLSSAN